MDIPRNQNLFSQQSFENSANSINPVFRAEDGSSLVVFVESNGVAENRPKLIRNLRANGATICSDVSLAKIILVEPSSPEGRQFVRDWGMDRDKAVLDVAWIRRSIEAGHALLKSENYGGCGNLDGYSTSDEEEDEDGTTKRSKTKTRKTSLPSSSQNGRQTRSSERRADSPSPTPQQTSQQTPTERFQPPSSFAGQLNAFQAFQQQPLQLVQNQQPLPSQQPNPFNMAVAPINHFQTQMDTQAFQNFLLNNPELFQTMSLMMMAFNANPQGWGNMLMSQPGFVMPQQQQQQMPMNGDMQGTPSVPQPGPSSSLPTQQSQLPFTAPHPGSPLESGKSISNDDSLSARASTFQSRIQNQKRKSVSNNRPRTSNNSVKRRKGLKDKDKYESSGSDEEEGEEEGNELAAVISASARSRKVRDKGKEKRRQETPMHGVFTDTKTGKPLRFYIQPQIYKHAEHVHRVKKNGGVITSELSDADVIILDTKSGKDRDGLLGSVNEIGGIALRIGYIEACLEMGAIVEEKDFIIGMSKSKHKAKKSPPKGKRRAEGNSDEDEECLSARRVKSTTRANRARKSTRSMRPVSKPLQRPPTPPSGSPNQSGTRGNPFTEEEMNYALDLGRYLLQQDPSLTISNIGLSLSEKVPTHSAGSWNNKLGQIRDQLEDIRAEVKSLLDKPISEKSEVEEKMVEEAVLSVKSPELAAPTTKTTDEDVTTTTNAVTEDAVTTSPPASLFLEFKIEDDQVQGNTIDGGLEVAEGGESASGAQQQVHQENSSEGNIPPPNLTSDDLKNDMETIINFFANPPEGMSDDEALWDALSNQQKCVTSESWQDFYDRHRDEVNKRLREALNLEDLKMDVNEKDEKLWS